MIYSTCNDDLSLSQFLHRQGCRLKHLIATSYTVDCQTLISLSAALYGAVSVGKSNADEINSCSLVDVCLEFDEIKQCAAEHLKLYTQYPPDNADMPAVLYENGIELFHACGTIINQPHLFHPKILLAVFEREDHLEFNLQVGSKNLTAGNALDLAICLEGCQGSPSENRSPNGSQLAQFFQQHKIQLPPGILQALAETEFQIPGGNPDELTLSHVVFGYTGPNGTISDILHEDVRCQPPIAPVHVFSPFLKPDSNGSFWGENLGQHWGQPVIYHTNLTNILWEQGQKTSFSNLYIAKADQRFYHGKLIMWPLSYNQEKESCEAVFRIWIGSANATENGMKKNTELMVGFQMRVTSNQTAMENRYPNYLPDLLTSKCTHMLLGRYKNYITPDNSIKFYQMSSFSLSETDCFPEDQSHLLRYLLRHISLHASIADQVPVVKMRLSEKWPGDSEYKVCLLHGDQKLCTLQHRNSMRCCAEKEFPPNGVYKIHILDAHDSPILQTYVQAVKEENGQSTFEFPKPTSMTALLSEIKALHAIPNCAVRGFSRSNDDIYRRLRAFLCSYHWDASPEHQAFQRLQKRIAKVKECLESKESQVYMEKREREKFLRLCAVVHAAHENRAHHKEV
jgi:hypothetical protein